MTPLFGLFVVLCLFSSPGSIAITPSNGLHITLSNTTIVYANSTTEGGRNATFICNVTGSPSSVTWSINGKQVSGSTPRVTITTSKTPSSIALELSVQSVNRTDDGTIVVCRANETQSSSQSSTAYLTVQVKPSVVLKPSSVQIREKSVIALNCTADGHPSPTILWRRNGIVIGGETMPRLSQSVPRTATNYSCHVMNLVGSASATTQVKVVYLDKPTVTSNTGNTVKEGVQANLTCSVTGSSPIHYRFKVNDTFLSGFQVSNTLTLPAAKRLMDGNYSCIANNSFGSMTSSLLLLPVLYLDKPTVTSDTGNTIKEGVQANLTCSVVGSSPIHYRFKVNNTFLSGFQMSNTLTLPAAKRLTDGNYSCIANNSFGSMTSSLLLLPVLYLDKPTVASDTGNTVKEGVQANLTCSVIGSRPINYRFKVNNTFLSGFQMSNTLTLSAAKRLMDGSYSCIANNSFGSMTSSLLLLNVIYLDKPTVTSNTGNTVKEGVQANLTCSVTGSSPIHYRFKVNNTFLSGYQMSNTLTLSAAKRLMDGSYSCIANNSFGSMTSSLLLLPVLYLDKPIVTSNTGNTIKEGVQANLRCSVVGSSPIHYRFKVNDTFLSDFQIGNTLTLPAAKRLTDGSYSCVANNSFGSMTSSLLLLPVLYLDKPNISSNTGSNVKEGVRAILTCSVVGSRPVHYRFKANDTFLSGFRSENTFTLPAAQRYSDGNYSCEANNSFGSMMSSSLFLSILFSPQVRLNQTHLTLRIGSPFAVLCTGVGSSPLTLKWMFNSFLLRSTSDKRTLVLTASTVDSSSNGTFVCTASNSEGSSMAFLTVIVLAPPGKPASLTRGAVHARNVSLGWTPPSFVGNSPVTNYTVEQRAQNVTVWSPSVCSSTPCIVASTAEVIINLLPFTNYTFRVTATNAIGTSGTNTIVGPILTDEDVPSSPVDVVASRSSSNTSVILSITWKIPQDTNGIILGYLIFLRQLTNDSNAITPAVVMYSVGAGSQSFLTPRVDANSQFNISIAANTSAGYGMRSTEVTVLSRQDMPQPVRDLQVTRTLSRSVQLSWKRPLNFFGVLVRYKVLFKTTTTGSFAEFNCQSRTMPTCTVTGLLPYTDYTFRVIVVNGFGESMVEAIARRTAVEMPPTIDPTVVVKPSGAGQKTFRVDLTAYKFPDTNGPILFYQIAVGRLTNNSKPLFSPQSLGNLPNHKDAVANFKGGLLFYITAEFNASEFSRLSVFDVGSGGVSSRQKTTRRRRNVNTEFENVALEPNTHYSGFLRAFVSDSVFSSSPWFETVQTQPIPPDEGSNSGKIIGGVIGAILIIALIVIIIAVIMKRRQRDQEEVDNGRLKVEKTSPKPQRLSQVLSDPRVPIRKSQFVDHVASLKANGGFGFSQEYSMISRNLIHPYKISSEPFNNMKNRYANVPAYDHSRVELESIDDIPGSDYINANYIEGYDSPNEYIAAQGPIPETVPDFWRMVWEKDAKTVVMLTQLEEKGRPKCAKYWPDLGSTTYRDFVVTSLEVLEYPDHVVRTFHLTRTGHHDERTIKQFHFIAWPDFGVPEPSPLLSLLRKVNYWKLENPGVLIVHCSAGVGRTGTYIVIDTQMKKLDKEGELNIFLNVFNIRDQRALMVQTEDQYIFVHDAVMEFIDPGNTEVQARDLRDYIKNQSQVNPENGMTGLMAEFLKLAGPPEKKEQKCLEAVRPVNQKKNRYFNIFPYDDSRVKLAQIPGVDGSDFINANYIDGYTGKAAFIATQAPIPSTIVDFWRMIWEQNCRTIVVLSKDFENGKLKVHVYWPNDKHTSAPVSRSSPDQLDPSNPRSEAYPFWPNDGSIKVNGFIVETINSSSSGDFIAREMKLTNTQFGVSRVVNHFQYISWPESGSPESGFAMIDLIGHVQKWNISAGSPPIVVQCSGGVGRTGVFIALTNLVERLKSEGVVDVYQTVKHMRRQREAMVQTRPQYEFCYRALQEYLDSFDLYSNFN